MLKFREMIDNDNKIFEKNYKMLLKITAYLLNL